VGIAGGLTCASSGRRCAPPLNRRVLVGPDETTEMRTYDLEIPLLLRVLPFLVLTFITVAVPAIILGSGGPTFLVLPVLAIAGWNWLS